MLAVRERSDLGRARPSEPILVGHPVRPGRDGVDRDLLAARATGIGHFWPEGRTPVTMSVRRCSWLGSVLDEVSGMDTSPLIRPTLTSLTPGLQSSVAAAALAC